MSSRIFRKNLFLFVLLVVIFSLTASLIIISAQGGTGAGSAVGSSTTSDEPLKTNEEVKLSSKDGKQKAEFTGDAGKVTDNRGNEFSGIKSGGEITFDQNQVPTSAQFTTQKGVEQSYTFGNDQFKVPEQSEVTFGKNGNKNIWGASELAVNIKVPDGGKISGVPTRAETTLDGVQNNVITYEGKDLEYTPQGEKSEAVKFSGKLSHQWDEKTNAWNTFVNKGDEFSTKGVLTETKGKMAAQASGETEIDPESTVTAKGSSDLNERTYVGFDGEVPKMPEEGGSYVSFGKEKFSAGSTNDQWSSPVAFEKDNPYQVIEEGDRFAVQAGPRSSIELQQRLATDELSLLTTKGQVNVDLGAGGFYTTQGGKQLVTGGGVLGYDASTATSPALDFRPQTAAGEPIIPGQKIITSKDGWAAFVPLDKTGDLSFQQGVTLDTRLGINYPNAQTLLGQSTPPVVSPGVAAPSGNVAPSHPDFSEFFGPETSARTENFIVSSPSGNAKAYAEALEYWRNRNAQERFGKEPAPLTDGPVLVTIKAGEKVGAGGATSYFFQDPQNPRGIKEVKMNIQGSRERLIDAVIPHETLHAVTANEFGRLVPRWGDEGACTGTECASEQNRLRRILANNFAEQVEMKKNNPDAEHPDIYSFSDLVKFREYPQDPEYAAIANDLFSRGHDPDKLDKYIHDNNPGVWQRNNDKVSGFYAQGASVTDYLVNQGGKQKFTQFLKDVADAQYISRNVADAQYGSSQALPDALLKKYYGFNNLKEFQNAWVNDLGNQFSSGTFYKTPPSANVVSPSAVVPSSGTTQAVPVTPSTSSITPSSSNPLEASVRIKYDDPSGSGAGSGTFIGYNGQDAIIATAGHLFKNGANSISIDTYSGRKNIPASLIDYYHDGNGPADVALIKVSSSALQGISPVSVAPQDYTPRVGSSALRVGCPGGGAFVETSCVVTHVNTRVNPAHKDREGNFVVLPYESNLKSSQASIPGESGGGLFIDGRLVAINQIGYQGEDSAGYASNVQLGTLLEKNNLGHLIPAKYILVFVEIPF